MTRPSLVAEARLIRAPQPRSGGEGRGQRRLRASAVTLHHAVRPKPLPAAASALPSWAPLSPARSRTPGADGCGRRAAGSGLRVRRFHEDVL